MTPFSSKSSVPGAPCHASAAPTPSTGVMAWLGEFVLTGLAHCCCAHYAMNPDLLDLAKRPSRPSVAEKAHRDRAA